jgi:hypothetical protein
MHKGEHGIRNPEHSATWHLLRKTNTPLECITVASTGCVEITHDGATQLEEVFLVAHFLGKEVSWVECAWDVDWLYFSQLDRFADTALADVNLAHVAGDGL